jgi:hypothetical protein
MDRVIKDQLLIQGLLAGHDDMVILTQGLTTFGQTFKKTTVYNHQWGIILLIKWRFHHTEHTTCSKGHLVIITTTGIIVSQDIGVISDLITFCIT